MTDIYIWFAEPKSIYGSDGERFIRAWTDDPTKVASLRDAIGKEPTRYLLVTTAPTVEKEASDSEWAPLRIWLQRGMGEEGSHTWCEDQIGEDSIGDAIEEVEYVRSDASPTVGDSAGEPTLRQFRWMSPTGETSDWQDTGPHEIEHLKKYPPSKGGRYEFRELYARPPAQTADVQALLTDVLSALGWIPTSVEGIGHLVARPYTRPAGAIEMIDKFVSFSMGLMLLAAAALLAASTYVLLGR